VETLADPAGHMFFSGRQSLVFQKALELVKRKPEKKARYFQNPQWPWLSTMTEMKGTWEPGLEHTAWPPRRLGHHAELWGGERVRHRGPARLPSAQSTPASPAASSQCLLGTEVKEDRKRI
jgi:hypothetical protein